jgi:hydroxyethylthiazole kinase-like uncharacterized protein yjeF
MTHWHISEQLLPVLSIEEARKVDQYLGKSEPDGLFGLMSKAGQATFDWLMAVYPETRKIGIVCGAGNNGGDGLVLAAKCHQGGLEVLLYTLGADEDRSSLSMSALRAAQAIGLVVRHFEGELPEADVWVDALLGIGAVGELREPVRTATRLLNQQQGVLLALDVPTGLNADTGEAAEDAVHADVTLTFLAPKRGLLTADGRDAVGDCFVAPLVEEQRFWQAIESSDHWHTQSVLWMPPSPVLRQNIHKHDRGRVLVVGGDYGMAGAPALAAEAALVSGAGKVTVATHSEHFPALMAHCPELMTCPLDHQTDQLKEAIQAADVIAIGPGLGCSDWAVSILKAVWGADCAVVYDADALNLMAQYPILAKQPIQTHKRWVMTPHPGEAARLLDITTAAVQADRFSAAQKLFERFHCTVLLKGAGSLVRTSRHRGITIEGNPGMATAGMGDVLTGIVAGMMALGLEGPEATVRAACLHAKAGDLAAEQGELGLKATDLLPYVRVLNNEY